MSGAPVHGNSRASKWGKSLRAIQLKAAAAKAQATSVLVNAAAGAPASTAGAGWASKPSPLRAPVASASLGRPRPREAAPAQAGVVYQSPNDTLRKAQRFSTATSAARRPVPQPDAFPDPVSPPRVADAASAGQASPTHMPEGGESEGAAGKGGASPEDAARRFVESRQSAHFDCAPELLAAVYATIAAATEEQPAADGASSSSSKSEKEEAVRAVLLQDPSLQAKVQSGRITIATMREWLQAHKLPKLPTNCLWAKAADTVLTAAREALVEVEATAQRELEQGAQDWAAGGVWKQDGMPRQYLAQLLAQDAATEME